MNLKKIWPIVVTLFFLSLVFLIGYGGFYIQRQVNWSWSYESMVEKKVEERIAPLEDRIKQLEERE